MSSTSCFPPWALRRGQLPPSRIRPPALAFRPRTSGRRRSTRWRRRTWRSAGRGSRLHRRPVRHRHVRRPLLTQVSRFDPWKDPLGVIDAYRDREGPPPDLQLALVASMAHDDPEGWHFSSWTERLREADPDIFLLSNLNSVGSVEVNAFQRAVDRRHPEVDPRGIRAGRGRGYVEGAAGRSPATSAGSSPRSRTARPAIWSPRPRSAPSASIDRARRPQSNA